MPDNHFGRFSHVDDRYRDWSGERLALVVLYLLTCIRVLKEYERGVIFRLGRAMPKPKGPGLIMVFGPVDRMMRVDLRTITKVIEPQDVITRDNVSVTVNAVLYFRVVDPMRVRFGGGGFLVRHVPGGLDDLAQHAGSGGTR